MTAVNTDKNLDSQKENMVKTQADRNSNLFRKEAMQRITSPDQLNDYLKVTNPATWVILVAILMLMVGILVWSMVGTLETTEKATAIITDNNAEIAVTGARIPEAGMPVRIGDEEYTIIRTETDSFGRTIAYADIPLPDGTYESEIVVEQKHAIDFLTESR